MRLGLLIYDSLDVVSGGYLYDRKLVEYLRSQGDQVEIVSLPWRNYLRHLGDNLSSELKRRLRNLSVDLLLQDELNHPSLFWLNHNLRLPYPVVSIVHHMRCSEQRPSWQNRLYASIERRYLTSIPHFIYNSQTTRGAVESLLGESRPHIVAVPAGDRFAPELGEPMICSRATQSGPLRLLFLGNLIPRKGLHVLLQALDRLPQENWSLDIVGSLTTDPRYALQMQRRAQKWGDRVRIWGLLPDSELHSRLLNSQVLVVPSSYEGFGIVYLEGMSFGLPALATDLGAASEIISDGTDGYLIPADNAYVLAERLGGLAINRQLLTRMSLAARQRYRTHPSWEQSSSAIRDFLIQTVYS